MNFVGNDLQNTVLKRLSIEYLLNFVGRECPPSPTPANPPAFRIEPTPYRLTTGIRRALQAYTLAWSMGDLEIISFHRENRETSAHALPPAPPNKIDIQTYNQSQKRKAKNHHNIILIWSVL